MRKEPRRNEGKYEDKKILCRSFALFTISSLNVGEGSGTNV